MSTAIAEKPYELSGWDLSELLADTSEPNIQTKLAEAEALVESFVAKREELGPEMAPAALIGMVEEYETIVEKVYVLSAYGSLWFSADTQSADALNYRNRMQQTITELQNKMLFFDLWWKSLDEDEAQALLPSAEKTADYRHHLEDLRRTKPFTLDETSEQIINIKDGNGISALVTLYSMLTNRLEFSLEIDGKTETLTRDALMSRAYSPDADMRAKVYQELYSVYGNEANILAQIYINRVRDWHNEKVDLRSYPSPISYRNVANDIPDKAVDALLEVSRKNTGLFQRYFKLKASWLGVEKLRRYDIYAPLAESDSEIAYDEAVKMVLETFGDFDTGVANHAERVFVEDHIDSEVRKGKRGGAFCATILPSQTPWVLMNYTGKVRDVATLAHELGHAIHSMMADEHSVLTQHAPLPLAETASVFAEMLLTDRLLDEVTEPLARRELLASAIDDMYATVMRQAYFVLFERTAHAAILENKSSDELHELYMENLREQFGDSLEIAPEFKYEWVSIPHIYNTPFYCYAYSFGQLLVLSLYRRFQKEGDSFIPSYLKMLSYGGSARPEQILNEVGIDMTDPSFWQGGFDVINELVDELESIKL